MAKSSPKLTPSASGAATVVATPLPTKRAAAKSEITVARASGTTSVAPDAAGFTLTLDDVEMMEDKSAVFDLGTLSSQAYDPASASASASPAAGQ